MKLLLISIGAAAFFGLWKWIYGDIRRGVYLSLFFIPLTVTLRLPLFEYKLILADIFIIFTLLSWFIQILLKKRKIYFDYPFLFSFLLLLISVSIFSMLNAADKNRALLEIFTYIYMIAFLFVLIQSLRDEEDFLKAVKCLLISGLGVILFGLVQAGGIAFGYLDKVTWWGAGWKITSTFRAPNQLPSYLVPLIPLYFIIFFRSRQKREVFFYFAFLLALFCVMCTGSRTGALMILAVLFLILLKYWRSRKTILLFVSFIVLMAFVLHLGRHQLLNKFPPLWQVYYFIINIGKFFSRLECMDPIRKDFMLAWWDIFHVHPWLGLGIGNFGSYFMEHFSKWGAPYELHNTYLSFWAETGTLGFSALILFLAGVTRCAGEIILKWKRFCGKKQLYDFAVSFSIGFISLLLYNFSHFGFRQRHFWMYIGFILISYRLLVKDEKDRLPQSS